MIAEAVDVPRCQRRRGTLPGRHAQLPLPMGTGNFPGETEAGMSGSSNHKPPTLPSDIGPAIMSPRPLGAAQATT